MAERRSRQRMGNDGNSDGGRRSQPNSRGGGGGNAGRGSGGAGGRRTGGTRANRGKPDFGTRSATASESSEGRRFRRPAGAKQDGAAAGLKKSRLQAGPRQGRQHVASTDSEVAEQNEALVVGRHPVLEALKSGRSINKILVAESSEGGSLTEILGKAKAGGVVVQRVPRSHLDSLVVMGNHQGVVAYVAAHDYVTLDEIVERQTGQAPLVVLLDEVSDPYNLGAVLRTAEATGVQGVVIPKRRAVPLTETVGKAAAGAMEYMPVARVGNLVQAIEQLKAGGYWIVGTDVDAKEAYTTVSYEGPIAIVIGAEGKGLGRLVRDKCDYLVSLPMLGQLQSLNASVATGVLLYEVVRQRS